MTRDKISYELFINEIRYKNVLSYMNLSKDYSPKEINSLYDSGQSKELDLSYLLGVLIMNDKTSSNHPKYIELAKKESEFRKNLLNSLTNKNNNKIKTILISNQISLENIKKESSSKNLMNFQPKRFIELIVSKKDLKIIQFFRKKKILSQKEMKEFIEK